MYASIHVSCHLFHDWKIHPKVTFFFYYHIKQNETTTRRLLKKALGNKRHKYRDSVLSTLKH